MKSMIQSLGLLLLAALLIGMATVFFGLFNVSARGGHWPVVSWVLHTTYRNSVALRAPSSSTIPELDDVDLVRLGARHYQQSCSVCHGEPDDRQLRTLVSMLPSPPPIMEAISHWEPNQLFWIIKHGVKMSGMPHWPALERDDDIWPVVAFLDQLPNLDAEQYQALLSSNDQATTPLAQPSDDVDPAALHNCTLCHGTSGVTDNAHVPRLDTLSREYLSATLKAYREQQRSSGIMQQAASLLDDETIDILAQYYASAQPLPDETEEIKDGRAAITRKDLLAGVDDATASSIERGRLLATGGAGPDTDSAQLPSDTGIPACNACHGPWPEPLSRHYPVIAAQSETYLLTQMQLWKSGTRGGTSLARLMHKVVPELDFQQMKDLAVYYSRLPAR